MSKSYAGVEDLLCDETFLSWYFKTDVRAVRQWEERIAGNPGESPRIRQAVVFLESLRIEEALPSHQTTRAEKRLLEKIRKAQSPVISLRRAGKWWIAAAGAIALAIGVYSIRLRHHPELQTTYGEIKNNQLPDGTEVIVNADSRVSWSSGWTDGKDREVWLAGEAFFHVRKTPLKSRFIVHADHFDVVVTGTRFNVVSRRDKSNVMLQEGSVTLETTAGNALKMTPGDFVEYSDNQLVKRNVKQDSVIAWKDHKLSFYDTPLRDVVSIIKEQYGVTIRLSGKTVGDKTISGIMPNDNLDVLLQSLAAIPDFQVIRQGTEIIIQDHP